MFSNFHSNLTAPDFQILPPENNVLGFFPLFIVHLIGLPSSRELLLQYSNVRILSKRSQQKQGHIPNTYVRVNFRYCEIIMLKILACGYSKVIQLIKWQEDSQSCDGRGWLLSDIKKAFLFSEELNKTIPKDTLGTEVVLNSCPSLAIGHLMQVP